MTQRLGARATSAPAASGGCTGVGAGGGTQKSTDLKAASERPRFIIPDDVNRKVSQVTDGTFSALQGGSF